MKDTNRLLSKVEIDCTPEIRSLRFLCWKVAGSFGCSDVNLNQVTATGSTIGNQDFCMCMKALGISSSIHEIIVECRIRLLAGVKRR